MNGEHGEIVKKIDENADRIDKIDIVLAELKKDTTYIKSKLDGHITKCDKKIQRTQEDVKQVQKRHWKMIGAASIVGSLAGVVSGYAAVVGVI